MSRFSVGERYKIVAVIIRSFGLYIDYVCEEYIVVPQVYIPSVKMLNL
jgi:hypothetical protein